MSAHQAVYPIRHDVPRLGVSPSGYYAWTKRSPSRRATRDGALIEAIRASHAASHGTYGAPRIQVDLATAGVHATLLALHRPQRSRPSERLTIAAIIYRSATGDCDAQEP